MIFVISNINKKQKIKRKKIQTFAMLCWNYLNYFSIVDEQM
jgi:hypothetical protein